MSTLTTRCNAQTSLGTPCRRFPIRGGTRCTLHGGGSPEARRVAEEMLAIARVPAARVLLQIVEDYQADPCEVCGRPSGDPTPAIRAATAVLDRTGFHPSVAVQVGRAPEVPPWIPWLTNDELAQVAGFIERATARMNAGEPREDGFRLVEATLEGDVGEVTVEDDVVQGAFLPVPETDGPQEPTSD